MSGFTTILSALALIDKPFNLFKSTLKLNESFLLSGKKLGYGNIICL